MGSRSWRLGALTQFLLDVTVWTDTVGRCQDGGSIGSPLFVVLFLVCESDGCGDFEPVEFGGELFCSYGYSILCRFGVDDECSRSELVICSLVFVVDLDFHGRSSC